jgi:hypothetical protein
MNSAGKPMIRRKIVFGRLYRSCGGSIGALIG